MLLGPIGVPQSMRPVMTRSSCLLSVSDAEIGDRNGGSAEYFFFDLDDMLMAKM